MIIGGLEKLTLIDYPGEMAAIVFTTGCNFRCHFCYNPMLVLPVMADNLENTSSNNNEEERDHSQISEDDLFIFLKSRQGKIEAVVVTGGEPTLHQDLPEFLARIKAMGFKVKLDTNGTNPVMLQRVLDAGLVDYLAMDLKATADKYAQVVGVAVNMDQVKKSIQIIKTSGLPYEFRTTVVPGLHEVGDIEAMGELIAGAQKWYLQFFKSNTGLIDKNLEGKHGHTPADMKEMRERALKYVEFCELRGD